MKINEMKLSANEKEMLEKLSQRLAGEDVDAPSFHEFLASPSAQVLIPATIIKQVRMAAEPLYIGTKLLKKIRMPNAQGIVIFPSIGVMRAADVAESQEFPEASIDWQTHEGTQIKINKSGLRVSFSQEMIDDSQWDIVALSLEQAGRAMARLKEEKAFRQFVMHGNTVFDNDIRGTHPDAGTTGQAYDGTQNDTMAIEDWLDLIIAVMNNELIADTAMMHPLAWPAFAKTALFGGYNQTITGNGGVAAPTSFVLGPDSIQGRIPAPLTTILSPFMTIDRVNKKFDIVVADSNNVGVLIEREAISTDRFTDPRRDIENVKMKERYGIGVLYEGRGIAVAKNIALDKSFAQPFRVHQIS
jgi:HK97 family phage major capsid protein